MSEAGPDTASKTRLDGLQMGRGIAATMVVVGHAILHTLSYRPAIGPLLGAYGVTLFFLISGFIMVKVSGEGAFAPGRFLLHRIQRIVPIYYVACGLLALEVFIAPSLFKTTHLEFWHVLRSLLFIPAYSPTVGPDAITPFFKLGWTLNFEMFFYAVFASLFFLRSAGRVLAITVLFGALMIVGQTVRFDQAIPTFYTQIDLASFVVGCWLGLWSQRGRIVVSAPAAIGLLIASLALILFVASDIVGYGKGVTLRLAMVSAAAMHIAILVGYFDRLRKAIHGWLLYLGDASYSIYLFHMFGIGPAAFVGKQLGPAFAAPSIVVGAIAGVGVGLMAYRVVEKPIMDMVKRRRRASESGASHASAHEIDAIASPRNATLH